MKPYATRPTPPQDHPDTPIRVILDTDPGIDDALAILLAICSPEIQVDGLSIVYGNCSVEQAVVNTLSVLELVDCPQIPVFSGAERPLVQPLGLAHDTHGTTGLGYAQLKPPSTRAQSQHAANFLIEHILSHPGEITLIMLGPLTNLALAMRLEPRIIPALRAIVVMGGAIHHPGNVSPQAEFNIACDPHAAHIVLHSGVPLTLVPLDVTYKAILTREDVDRLLQIASPISQFIADATRFYMGFHAKHQGILGCAINDPLALTVVFSPHLVSKTLAYVDVDISGGVSMGKTFADLLNTQGHPPNSEVALSVNAPAFMDFFMSRMQALAQTVPGSP